MLNKKALLFVGAGLETVPGMRLAAEMGLRVVASDANINAPGMSIANDRILASTYDINETVAAASKFHTETWPLSGVLCLGTDVPMTVAAVAATLGLPGVSTRSALLAADKLAMKDCFVAHGVPIPWYASIESAIELQDIFSSRAETMVIKPVDSRGARGVLKLSSGVDLDWAYAYAREYSPTGRVMVETYLDGPQVSTESLVIDGACHTPGFSDRNYEYLERFAPNIIENGGELPTCLDANSQKAIRLLVDAGARAMGVCNGGARGFG